MDCTIAAFKVVSITFAMLAVFTGAQALVDPVGFSKSFGLTLEPTIDSAVSNIKAGDASSSSSRKAASHSEQQQRSLAKSYASLMGVRQIGTGLTLLTFAYKGNWAEAATILAIIGFVVAGTDGFFLARAGYGSLGRFHAIPGAGIAILAAAAIYVGV
ncbi:hypothetical protein B0A54_11601 [Friedmanniomyces endolithicus]|uniref:DUF4267 domain-containing protein n=1 Tax=Friedmanniomyces endolithicus TaxID=329885 RepID=A0A4U0UM02_9PEZI|nr:hypothetical protein LTS09_010939 [Friedmanniomyces endolithicus]KAK0312716.1 hypothetical protein LTR01_002378 [Friedmanniomyces endolithicus]KAK0827431.1 hypothetical protein LTR73_005670 [Friedmanniomyces endolithicus]TKA36733.1 hypothetical protein B0A54_11601 [Friedmanniomyces endolithicus]